MLGITNGTVCSRCHNPENPQYGATVAGADVAKKMRSRLDQLKHEITEAKSKIQEAERLGMQVRGSRFDLRQAFDALTNARTLVHSFSPGPIEGALDEGLKVTSDVRGAAEGALREYTKRPHLAGQLSGPHSDCRRPASVLHPQPAHPDSHRLTRDVHAPVCSRRRD